MHILYLSLLPATLSANLNLFLYLTGSFRQGHKLDTLFNSSNGNPSQSSTIRSNLGHFFLSCSPIIIIISLVFYLGQ